MKYQMITSTLNNDAFTAACETGRPVFNSYLAARREVEPELPKKAADLEFRQLRSQWRKDAAGGLSMLLTSGRVVIDKVAEKTFADGRVGYNVAVSMPKPEVVKAGKASKSIASMSNEELESELARRKAAALQS